MGLQMISHVFVGLFSGVIIVVPCQFVSACRVSWHLEVEADTPTVIFSPIMGILERRERLIPACLSLLA